MAELNATMFYKVKFSISAAKPDSDLLWKIIMHIKDWQIKKCAKRHLSLWRFKRLVSLKTGRANFFCR